MSRDEAYHREVADAVCGERVQCMGNFWTDRAHVFPARLKCATAAERAE